TMDSGAPRYVARRTRDDPYDSGVRSSVGIGRAEFGPPGYQCDHLYIASIVVLLLIGPTPWSVDNYRSRASTHAARSENGRDDLSPRPSRDCYRVGYRVRLLGSVSLCQDRAAGGRGAAPDRRSAGRRADLSRDDNKSRPGAASSDGEGSGG